MTEKPLAQHPGALACALLVIWAATLLAYANSFSIPFQFDDTHTVQANMYAHSLKHVPRYFVDARTSSYRPETSGYRPMTTLALALGYSLSQLEPWGYHLIKLIEHCLVAMLVFLVGLRLVPRTGVAAPYRFWVAACGALIFAVHRALSETVDYISAVSTLQAGLFHLLGFWLYLRWREEPVRERAKAFYAFSLLSFLCSLWSKEEGITLPAMIFAYEWLYQRKPDAERVGTWLKYLAPYVVLGLAYVALRESLQPEEADAMKSSVSPFIYFITQLRAWLLYWKLFLFPVELNADNLAFDFSAGLDDWRVWASAAAHVAIWAAAWRAGRKFRFVLFAVAWAYITVLPASSVFPLGEAVNEHRFYIPYMLLSLLASWAIFEGAGRLAWLRGMALSFGRNAGMVTLLLCALALGAGARDRNKVWQSELALWEDVYAKNPASPRAMNVLGVSLFNAHDFERSQELLEKCHSSAPTYLPCIVHLSMVYAQRKQYDRGLEILKVGNRLDPNFLHINYHLGLYYKDYLGDYDRARHYLMRVHRHTEGRYYQAILKVGEMELEDADYDQGLAIAKQVLDVDPSNGQAGSLLGKAYLLKGDYQKAGLLFQKLVESDPNSTRYWLNASNLAERRGDYSTAAQLFARATEKEPLAIQAWQGLARVSRVLGDKATVQKAEDRVRSLQADSSWVFYPSMFLTGEKPRQIRP